MNSDGVCTLANGLCHTFNRTNGDCLTCYGGYRLYGAICVVAVSNCATYDGRVCSTCVTGYTLVNGTCQQNLIIVPPIIIPTIANCSSYSGSLLTRVCVACVTGYTLVSGQCFVAIPECLSYNSSGQCVTCFATY